MGSLGSTNSGNAMKPPPSSSGILSKGAMQKAKTTPVRSTIPKQ